MSLNSLLQSEYVLAAFFISTLGLIGFLTYLFGFKQNDTKQKDDETSQTKTKATSKTKQQKEVAKTKKPDSKKVESAVAPVVQAAPPTPVQAKKVDEPAKSAKKAEPVKKVVEAVKKQQPVKKEVQKVEEPVVQVSQESVDTSGWTTVVDKRAEKKKQKSATPASSTDNEDAAPSAPKSKGKKAKSADKPVEAKVEVNDQLVIGTKQPSELLTESVIEKTETKAKEDDWIPANPKAKKDKKKDKKEVAKESVKEVEVKPQVVPVVPEVKEVEKSKPKKAKKASQQQSVASAIQDAIVDTLESKATKLKQTSLTDSLILIEKENGSKRTESNQSSNESLQDVDGDDGFITITNKKSKRAVRREQ